MICTICYEELRRHEFTISFGIMGNEKPDSNEHCHFNCFVLKIKGET